MTCSGRGAWLRQVEIRDGALAVGAVEGDPLAFPLRRLRRLFDPRVERRLVVLIGGRERRELLRRRRRERRHFLCQLDPERALIAGAPAAGARSGTRASRS